LRRGGEKDAQRRKEAYRETRGGEKTRRELGQSGIVNKTVDKKRQRGGGTNLRERQEMRGARRDRERINREIQKKDREYKFAKRVKEIERRRQRKVGFMLSQIKEKELDEDAAGRVRNVSYERPHIKANLLKKKSG